MSDMQRGMLEFKLDRTRAYVIHKGHLPKSADELIEWLNEFAEYERRVADLMEQQLKEHLNCCIRPIIFNLPKTAEGSERE